MSHEHFSGGPDEVAGRPHGRDHRGAQGLGRAIAERFVADGARVVIGDVDLAAAQACAAELGDALAVAVRCDVTSEEEMTSLVGTRPSGSAAST